MRARRTSLVRRPVLGCVVAVQEISKMADRRDWGGGGDDPEESTQRMIERIWESLTDIRARMDQQAPVPPIAVPPGDGEAIPVAPVLPRVEVPFVAPVPPPPPVQLAEEPVMQVEKFLRLQPPTYSGGPNPDTAEHWVHEIERVFATMRCPAAERVVLAAYQLRGFALEWWRLKMQTTFAGRTEEAITWPEFLDVFNDTFFPIQVQQVKREQFRTLQQEAVRRWGAWPCEAKAGRRAAVQSLGQMELRRADLGHPELRLRAAVRNSMASSFLLGGSTASSSHLWRLRSPGGVRCREGTGRPRTPHSWLVLGLMASGRVTASRGIPDIYRVQTDEKTD
ncbi:hypothetical protein Taro_007997 [Colocasia esculenta]|uniref:Retrotransposon gag domain-containing protein n=1 Tax=Colocasia esculenta TaxID=4460 RepID=A0A843TSP7_COLES|nr:hypothetical protein [Colocasia esculenta]